MEDRFNPNLTYRFVIFFSMGDNDAVDELGPERVVVKSFTIGMTEEHFSRLIYLDDHTDGAWTRFWQKTAWKFGQLGECTDPSHRPIRLRHIRNRHRSSAEPADACLEVAPPSARIHDRSHRDHDAHT